MKNVLIFGDSYSTHKDGIPNGFRTYYCNEGRVDGPAVTKMQIIDTWWYKFVSKICNIVPISLNNIEKEKGHPTLKGMNAICEEVLTEY